MRIFYLEIMVGNMVPNHPPLLCQSSIVLVKVHNVLLQRWLNFTPTGGYVVQDRAAHRHPRSTIGLHSRRFQTLKSCLEDAECLLYPGPCSAEGIIKLDLMGVRRLMVRNHQEPFAGVTPITNQYAVQRTYNGTSVWINCISIVGKNW